MKITAQLALSQMKVNKKRTIAGIFAIALATSLITTVMCFVTSANKMLTDFLGSDYGEYGGAYSLMLAIPALLLGLLIAARSITVISNIFSANVAYIRQMYKCQCCCGTCCILCKWYSCCVSFKSKKYRSISISSPCRFYFVLYCFIGK